VIDLKKVVIGEYADYYIEWDGMVESGPGCMERMQARIDALPDGHPSKVRLIPEEYRDENCLQGF
jgi:hypothetical protein